jgi:hypothetical protein
MATQFSATNQQQASKTNGLPPSTSTIPSAALIIVLWRHRLSLNGFRKPKGIRLIVVGPSELVVDEEQLSWNE